MKNAWTEKIEKLEAENKRLNLNNAKLQAALVRARMELHRTVLAVAEKCGL
jgi:hypothetical protein